MKVKYLVLLVFIVLAIASCKKDTENTSKNLNTNSTTFKSGGISIVNGRMVFSDTLVFRSYITWIKDNLNNQSVIYNFNNSLGFESFVQAYDNGMKTSDSAGFLKYVEAHPYCYKLINVDGENFLELPLGIIISNITNPQGIYQIGNKIIRETENTTLTITNADESKLPKLFFKPSEINDPSIVVNDYGTPFFTGQYSYKTEYFESKKRIVARLYYTREIGTNFPQYEARTTSQKKGWTGIWVQENITQIGQKNYAGVYYTYCNTYWGTPLLGPYTVDASLPNQMVYNNQSDIRLPIVKTPGYKVEFTTSSCIVDHWGYRGSTKKEILNNDLFPDNF